MLIKIIASILLWKNVLTDIRILPLYNPVTGTNYNGIRPKPDVHVIGNIRIPTVYKEYCPLEINFKRKKSNIPERCI